MRVLTSFLVSATALALVQAAGAAETKAAEAPTINCGAPIAWDATEETLKKQFGADNIVHKDVGGPEGMELFATVVNEKDPAKAFIVVWADDEKRINPQMIMVNATWDAETGVINGGAIYATDEGVKVGMPIEEVEKINGKPFKLSGFGWDYGGAPNFEGGKLQQAEDTKCWLSMTFTTTAETLPDTILGEQEIMSNAKDVLAAKPVVGQFTLSYMRPDAEAPQ